MLSLLSMLSRSLTAAEIVLKTMSQITDSCNAGLTKVNAATKSAHAARKAKKSSAVKNNLVP